MAEFFAANVPQLEDVRIRQRHLAPGAVATVVGALSSMTRLRQLTLEVDPPSGMAESLGRLVADLPKLEWLRVAPVGPAEAACLGAALNGNVQLGTLWLDLQQQGLGVDASSSEYGALVEGLCNADGLVDVTLAGFPGPWSSLEAHLPHSSMLMLQLDNAHVGADGGERLAKALARDPPLWSLSLVECGLDADDIAALSAALQRNSHLHQLDVAVNPFEDAGVQLLARALATNRMPLRRLTCSCNDATGQFSTELAAALRSNTILQSLEVCANGLGSEGAKEVAEGARQNVTLTHLVYDQQPADIAELCRSNKLRQHRRSDLIRWKLLLASSRRHQRPGSV